MFQNLGQISSLSGRLPRRSSQSSLMAIIASCSHHRENSSLLGRATSSDLYRLQASSCSRHHPSTEEHVALSVHSKTSADLWHQRLGHLNGRSLQLLHQHKMVTGLDAASDLTGNCVGCVLGKHHRKTFSSLPASHQRQARLELVHTDLCGPMDESSLGGKHYLLTFIDDCTRRA